MASARTEERDQLRSFQVGADTYVTKPFDPERLVTQVKGLLRRDYFYDSPAAPVSQEHYPAVAASTLPPGWVQCDACQYMAPTQKFERHLSQNQVEMQCPHCGEKGSLTVTLG